MFFIFPLEVKTKSLRYHAADTAANYDVSPRVELTVNVHTRITVMPSIRCTLEWTPYRAVEM